MKEKFAHAHHDEAKKILSLGGSLRNVRLSVPDERITPLGAFMCTYRMGVVRHGEVILLYRSPGEGTGSFGLDVIDRMAVPVNSAMRSHFATSPYADKLTTKPHGARRLARLRAHYVRAFSASATRGFKLRERCCHAAVDLRDTDPLVVNKALAAAIQERLHPEGFSYGLGRHCVAFANDLCAVLRDLGGAEGEQKPCAFGELPTPMAEAQCPVPLRAAGMCSSGPLPAPALRAFLKEHFPEACTYLEAQEAAVMEGLTRGSRVRLAIGRAIDPGDYWVPKAWMKLVPKANKDVTVRVHASTTRDAASISLSVHQAREDADLREALGGA